MSTIYPSAPKQPRASTAQRAYIDRLFRQAEYDTRTISLPHRALAQRAGLTEPTPGTSLDGWLSNMTLNDASKLIVALKRETDEETD